jgi:hypothetical protein
MAFIYWITTDKLLNPLLDGYIGLTSLSVASRLKSHQYSYSQFVKGKSVGCKKLYSTIKKLGGWEKVSVVTICESNTDYCVSLENKLRPEPDTGWNTRVGGEYDVMYKREVTVETKLKLVEVRKSWVLSQESRVKLSKDRKGNGNPMYGVLPWLNPASNTSSKFTWLFAGEAYNHWLNTQQGVKKMSRFFTNLNYWTLDSMIRKFREGWIPNHDTEWTKYKEQT